MRGRKVGKGGREVGKGAERWVRDGEMGEAIRNRAETYAHDTFAIRLPKCCHCFF